jgi:2'-5' RNA ligase
VLYSRKECPNIEHSPIDLPIKASGIAFSIFPNSDGGNCLVIELGSDEMQSLHSTLKEEHGATHDYDSYKPHITLSYDYSNNPLPGEAMLEHFWNLTFDQFMVEPLTFNCVSN